MRETRDGSLKLGIRTKSGLVLALGVLVGLGFISLPGILTTSLHPNKTTTPTTSTNSTTTPSPNTTGFSGSTNTVAHTNQTSPQQNAADNMISIGVLPILFGLLVVPALGISLLTMVLVTRRTRRPSRPEHDQS